MREIMVRAECIYTAEHFKAAGSVRANGKTPYAPVFATIALCAGLGAWALASTFRAIDRGSISDGCLMVIFSVILIYFGFTVLKTLLNRDAVYEKAASKNHMRHFVITEDEFVMYIDSDIEHSERHFALSGLYRVIDTGKFFIVYLYEDMYSMIGYGDITEGDPVELRALFSGAIGSRLVIKES